MDVVLSYAARLDSLTQREGRDDMRKSTLLALCLAHLLWFVGCGGGMQNQPTASPIGSNEGPPLTGSNSGLPTGGIVQGNWFATLTSRSIAGSQTTVDVFIVQRGNTLAAAGQVPGGRVFFGGSGLCAETGSMTGTVDGTMVTLTLQHDGLPDKVMVTGNMSNSSSLTGTYTTSGACANGDAGDFSALLYPAVKSGSWSGEVVSPNGDVAPFTAIMSVDSSYSIGDQFTFSNWPCTGTNLTTGAYGVQIGRRLLMTDETYFNATGYLDLDHEYQIVTGKFDTRPSGSPCGVLNFTMSP